MHDADTVRKQAEGSPRIAELMGDIATLECRVHNLENQLSSQRFWGDVYDQQNRQLKGEVELLTAKNIVLQHRINSMPCIDIVVS